MNRRAFTKLTAASLTLAQIAPAIPSATPGKMKLGTQHQSSDEVLRILAALGKGPICSDFCHMIKKAASAGIPMLKCNRTIWAWCAGASICRRQPVANDC